MTGNNRVRTKYKQETRLDVWKYYMRLKSINIYSDYLGDPENTKARTGELRHDAEFLDYIFWPS